MSADDWVRMANNIKYARGLITECDIQNQMCEGYSVIWQTYNLNLSFNRLQTRTLPISVISVGLTLPLLFDTKGDYYYLRSCVPWNISQIIGLSHTYFHNDSRSVHITERSKIHKIVLRKIFPQDGKRKTIVQPRRIRFISVLELI